MVLNLYASVSLIQFELLPRRCGWTCEIILEREDAGLLASLGISMIGKWIPWSASFKIA